MTAFQWASLVASAVGLLISLGILGKLWSIATRVGRWEQWMETATRTMIKNDVEMSALRTALNDLSITVAKILGQLGAEWNGQERRKN